MIQRSQQKFWAILPSDPYPEIGFERTLGRRILEAILSSNPLIAVRHEVDEVLAAKLSKDHRSTSIYTASSKRMFISSFWSRGVLLANYGTSSLPQVVQAVKSWLVDDLTLLQMKEKTANLVVSDVALATEAGEGVAARWKALLSPEPWRDYSEEFMVLIATAACRPLLRQFVPVVSLGHVLLFSRTIGYPFALVRGYAGWAEGRYWARKPNGKLLGEGTIEQVLDLVESTIPTDTGPAIYGTAIDLI